MDVRTGPVDCVESLLREMVRIDSVSRHFSGRAFPELELAVWLESLARSWGLEVTRFDADAGRFNVLITAPPIDRQPWLLFESHMDTVGLDGMTIEPLSCETRDGKVFGWGTCDTKSSGAAMLWALRLHASRADRHQNVALLLTVDEECTNDVPPEN